MRYAIVGRTVNDAFAPDVKGSYDGRNSVSLQLGTDRLDVPVLGPKVAGKFDTPQNLKPIIEGYSSFFRLGIGAAANVESSLWQSGGASGIETHLVDESGSDSFLGGSRKYSSLEAHDRPWNIIYPDGSSRVVIRQKVSGQPKLAYLEAGLRGADVIVLTKTNSRAVSEAVIEYAQDNAKPLYVGGINNDPKIAKEAITRATTVLNLEEQLRFTNSNLPRDYDAVIESSKSLLLELPISPYATFISAGAFGNGGRWYFKGEPWVFHITPGPRISALTSEYAKKNPLDTNGMGDDLLAKHAIFGELSTESDLQGEFGKLVRSGLDLLESMGLGGKEFRPLQSSFVASMALSRRLGYSGTFERDDFLIDAAPLKK